MDDGLILDVHVVPGARRTEVAGAYGEALRVRLAAPPVDGKANTALIRWAAASFGLPRRDVRLLRGASSRRKQLQLRFASVEAAAAARRTIASWMAES